MINKIITKRSILGTILLAILIGEPTVGMATGIFTPPGIVIFFFLYLTLFHLFDSIIATYHLVVYQVILITFAIYSVLVTGLLHKELTEFITQPGSITLLIRIQASFFATFAFYLLNSLIPRDETKMLTIKQASIFFAIFILVLSTTGTWGLPSVLLAFKMVPELSLLFSIVAIGAIWLALSKKAIPTEYKSKKLTFVIYFYLIMGSIPNIATFMVLLITMIFGGIFLLLHKTARNHPL